MSSAAAAGNRAFGIDRGLPFPVEDIGRAGAVLLLGSNVADTMPPFVQHLTGARDRGGLVVVDPRVSATAALTAEGAGLHLQALPGTDLAAAAGDSPSRRRGGLGRRGVPRPVVRPAGTTYAARSRPGGPLGWPPPPACPSRDLREAASILADASPHRGGPGAMVLTGRGAEQHADGTDTVTAAINLALALGLPGSSGVRATAASPVRATARAAASTGRSPTSCPATAASRTPLDREHVAAVWGVDAGVAARQGRPRGRAARQARHRGARADGARQQPAWSAPPTRPPYDAGWATSTCSWSATSCRARPPSSPTSCCR